ncbi:hypothetical protein SEA_BRAXOADDIE_2 [Rhodococcus phage Braxoaddie]|nr:hypothetical protein SEA_BRAXOADDIE_2 [Rhodococcus phage Braxoaddie]
MNETTPPPDHEPSVQYAPCPRPPYPGYDLPERFAASRALREANDQDGPLQGFSTSVVWIDEWATFATADDIQSKVTSEYAQHWLDRYATGTQLSDLGTFALPEHFTHPQVRPRRRSAFAPGGNVSPKLPILARRDGGQFSAVSDDDVAKAICASSEAREDEVKSGRLLEQAKREAVQLQAAAEKRYAKFRKQREVVEQLEADFKANQEHREECDRRASNLDRARRTQLQVPVEPQFDPNGHVVIEYVSTTPTGRIQTKHLAVRRRSGQGFYWCVTGQDGSVRWDTLLRRIQSGETDRQAALDSVKLIAYTPSPEAEGLAMPTLVKPRF